jgi:hypothetical protein
LTLPYSRRKKQVGATKMEVCQQTLLIVVLIGSHAAALSGRSDCPGMCLIILRQYSWLEVTAAASTKMLKVSTNEATGSQAPSLGLLMTVPAFISFL